MSSNIHPTLLRIDASARVAHSFSRQIADAAQEAWQQAHPDGAVIHRDLASHPLPHIENATIQGFYTPPSEMTEELRTATSLSDTLIAELKCAHTVLIASPIYNFSVPSALKAWIDQVVRIGHTFAYEDGQFRGLVQGPRAVLALAYGAGEYQGPLAQMDHLRPYLLALLGFLGITDIQVLAAEATTSEAATTRSELDRAVAQAHGLFNPAPQSMSL